MEEKNKDEMYMRMALAEAKKAFAKDEIPIGCVIVCHDTIVARAYNLTETLTDPTAHAEMQAITMAANALGGKYLTDCTLYVTVEPCPMCAGAIGWAQVPHIVYGAPDPLWCARPQARLSGVCPSCASSQGYMQRRHP